MPKKVWLIGDLITDCFHYGEIDRLAQEAPVPILKEARVEIKPGGAGNVAMSLALMGLDTYFLTDEHFGGYIDFVGSGFESAGVKFPTPPIVRRIRSVKHRFVAKNHGQSKYAFRWDEESEGEREGERDAFDITWLDRLKEGSGVPELLVVCDYGKGLLTSDKIRQIIEWGLTFGIPTIVDAHPRNIRWMDFWAAYLVKMNREEFDEGEKFVSHVNIEEEMQHVCRECNIQRLVVTNDRDGAYLGTEEKVIQFQINPREVADVCGAGDVFLGALVYAKLSGYEEVGMVKLANSAAGWAVQQFGTAVLSEGVILGLRSQNPTLIREEEDIVRLLQISRDVGQKVVFTNGCFDLVHPGHIYLLQEARKRGNVLVVAINSDESVRKLKGEGRPILNEQQRAFALSALHCVDHVVIQKDDNPQRLIRKFKPEVVVKGSTTGGDYPEAEVARECGGSFEIISAKEDISTSKIVEQITNGT